MFRTLLFIGTQILLTMLYPMAVKAGTEVSLLKDLDVTNGIMIQYEPQIILYTVELFEGETEIDVIAVPKNDQCIVTVEGDETPMELNSERIVRVSAHDDIGNFETYILMVYSREIIPEAERGWGLNYLACENGIISPHYRASAEQYYIILKNDQTEAILDIRPKNREASITVTGNKDLQEGVRSRAQITITETNGIARSYRLYIYRESQIRSQVDRSFLLSSVEINGRAVEIDFNQNKGYYDLSVPKSVKTLQVTAIAQDRTNVVDILGSSAMDDKTPVLVTIVVRNPDFPDKGMSVYTLRLVYDSTFYSAIYSHFQMIVVAAVTAVATLAASAAFFLHRRGR